MSLPRPLPPDVIDAAAPGLSALAEPWRLHLVETLDRVGERNVQALADTVGTSQQNASKHLAVLHATGLVLRRREGRVVWYAVAGPDVYRCTEQITRMIVRHLPGAPMSPTR